ncbi:MAG: SusC/RagA family TonB-linked outer membrane protein [Tannerella sp.]|jgi:TonB-linked SusC/RagA family outer membrane protein|nr:SusC/RagA family TonB-linked outer membrane protein [Tannerella sp.]
MQKKRILFKEDTWRKALCLLCVLFMGTLVAFAQKRVTGTVVDDIGETVVGANIVEKGTTNGVITDAGGKFSLTVAGSNSVLLVSYIGYATQEVAVGNKTELIITLMEDTKALEEVVVVGYGTQKRSEVTAAVSTLTNKDFNTTAAASSVMELAKGKLAGVVITNVDGGDPRSGASIQIRGINTLIGSTSPLVVIDDVPGGSLDLLRPEDIESFNVLKDASAAAIYGTRGSNGVIIITTKKAQRNIMRTTFDYSGYVSHDYVYNSPEILTAEEYRAYMQAGGYNSNLMVDFGKSTNWPDLLTDKNNMSQNHNLSMTGGNSKTNYRASIYFRDVNPIAIESDQSNWGGRLNINHTGLNDRLNVQLTVSTDMRSRNNVGENGAWEQVSQRNPTEPAKDEDGEWLEDGAYNSYNPLARYSTRENYSTRTTWLGTGKVTLTVLEGLKVAVRGSWQQYDNITRGYYYRDSKTSQDSYQGGGYASKSWSGDIRRTIESTVDYARTFNEIHSFNAIVGHSYEYHVDESFNAYNSVFLTDAFKDNNLGNGTGMTLGTSYFGMGSSKSDDKLAAFFGRINYVLNSKYQLSATLRHEGSSRFGRDKRWGNFPAVSAGWIISKESFMDGIDFINNLKLRAGVGVTGNIPSSNYLYMTTLGTGGQYPVAGGTWYQTYGPARNPNTDLQWEEKQEWNIGLEYAILKDRIKGTIDFYTRRTKNLLDSYNAQLPPFVLSTVYTNVGTISNKGIELGINATPVETRDFGWDINATFFYQKNILESLSDEIYKATYKEWGSLPSPGALGNAIRTEEGKSLGGFYGKRFAGFNENGQWLFYNKANEVVTLSEVKPEDLTYIGNGIPKYYASLGNTLRYKGLDLTIFLRGKFDYQILNLKELYFGNLNWLPNNVLKSATTKHAELHDAPQYSDYYLENGDFVKIDNITLGYNFKFKPNDWVRSLRVYVSAQNLATFTSYSGVTPEVQDTGFTVGMENRSFFPATSTVMFGINFGF